MGPAELRRLIVRHRHVAPMLSVLLAGTDLSMVLNEANAGFPTIDCAGVHIAEITRRLLA